MHMRNDKKNGLDKLPIIENQLDFKIQGGESKVKQIEKVLCPKCNLKMTKKHYINI